MFEEGFPKELRDHVQLVATAISKKTYNNVKIDQSEQTCNRILTTSEKITFPYRIYYADNYDDFACKFSPLQKMIYNCIFSRSCNGFVREKHIASILSVPFPTWAIPYIIKICEEYVVEILETVYQYLNGMDTEDIKLSCRINAKPFLCGHDRMISYWNEYYRQ